MYNLAKILRIDVLNYLEGTKACIQVYSTYEKKREHEQKPNKEIDSSALKKVREHQRDVVLGGVVWPALSRTPQKGAVFVDDLMKHSGLTEFLYTEILAFSYGLTAEEVKKKAQSGF